MANRAETTFGSLQMDERQKKLERSLKLALLKQKHSRNMHNRMGKSIPTWPSVSSINADSMDFSFTTPSSLQVSRVGSDVLASSNNFNSMLPKRKSDINKGTMVISSVKHYNTRQNNHVDQCIMPPPMVNKVYHSLKKPQNRVYSLLESEKIALTPPNSSIQSSAATTNFFSKNSKINIPSCVSANVHGGNKYLDNFTELVMPKELQKFDRVFSKWRVMLNDKKQLLIKGTERGRIVRSKPVVRRYSTTCVESISKYKYYLEGNITDERNELPDYIRGKFYNGFPDDWENVYQIWRKFVSQGCLVTFRWPTPIADSDDDLKSEMTDVTYVHRMGNKSNTGIRSFEETEPIKKAIRSISPNNESPEKVKKCHNCTCGTQSNEGSRMLVKSFVSDTAKQYPGPAAQAINASNEENQKNGSNLDQLCSPRKMNNLKDFFQKDKLNIIINNLADRNCSPKYIDMIIEMFSCLDYVTSYGGEAESTYNFVSESCNTSKSEAIPLKQKLSNQKNINYEFEKLAILKSHERHSADLGYNSIKNDTEPSQVESNIKSNVKPGHEKHKDSDDSEGEIYAGVPKISMKRVLQAREAIRKLPKRKMRKKAIEPEQQVATNKQHDVNITHEFTVPTANVERRILPPDESCISITEEEIETPENTRAYLEASIFRRSQRANSFSNQLQKTNSDVRSVNVNNSKTQSNVQERLLDSFQPQRTKSNVITRRKATDISCATSSDDENDVVVTGIRAMESCNFPRNVGIARGKDDNNFTEKPRVSQKSRKELVELPAKNESAVHNRTKPVVVSSIPVNMNIKIAKADVHRSACDTDVSFTTDEDKQRSCVLPREEARKKPTSSPRRPSASVKPDSVVANKSPSKTTVDGKKKNQTTSNTNIKKDGTNLACVIKTTTKQSKKFEENAKTLIAWVPRVVHHPASKNELGLTFQGKLLNEADHIMHRNFTTDIVLKRLSATLIETVNHDFYKLLGSMNNNKCVIPKELVKQCRNGCPAKIEQFCLMWKSLHNVEKIKDKSNDTSMDSLARLPISSRGRRILPPLSYWTGERVTLKDNTPVYNLGNSLESSLINKSPKKIAEKNNKHEMDMKNTSKHTVNKQKSEENEVSGVNKNQMVTISKIPVDNSPQAKVVDNTKKYRKSATNVVQKRKIVKTLNFSSSDTDGEEEQQVSLRKRSRNLQSNTNTDAKVQTRRCSMTLRKRQKIDTTFNKASPEDTKPKYETMHHSPAKKSHKYNIKYSYHHGVPQDDLLSEVSPM